MRKHQKRWVALLGAVAISTGGLGALPGAASADDKEPRSLSWPVVKQGETSYNIDGYAVGYLPPGLSEYSVNATSSTDRRGNGESQVSWVQGPDQLYGRVAVVRSERLQELDDLRDSRYSHLSEGSLEHLEDNEAFEHGAYLSEGTGDLFWLDRPGVAVTTHLQPERWDSDELVQLAASVSEEAQAEGDASAEPVGTEGTEDEEPQKAEEAGAEAPEEEPDQEGSEDSGEEEAQEGPEDSGEEGSEDAEDAEEDNGAPEDPDDESDGSTDGEDAADTGQGEDEAPEAPSDEAEEGAEDPVPADEGTEDVEGPEEQEDGANPADGDAEDTGGSEEETDQGGSEGTEEQDSGETGPEEQEETGSEGAEAAEGTEEPAEADVPAEADLPEGTGSRAVKDCLIGQFVDVGSGEADLDGLSPENEEFVERALAEDELSGSDRDRLLATVWYHGDEDGKNAATDECAQRFGLERSEVEDVIAEVSDLTAAMEDEADQGDTTDSTDEPSHGTDGTGGTDASEAEADEALDGLAVNPVGAGEWEELWAPLSWSAPAEES